MSQKAAGRGSVTAGQRSSTDLIQYCQQGARSRPTRLKLRQPLFPDRRLRVAITQNTNPILLFPSASLVTLSFSSEDMASAAISRVTIDPVAMTARPSRMAALISLRREGFV